MKTPGPAKAFTGLLTAGVLLWYAVPATAADTRPFETRFASRVNGDISIVTATSPTATSARPAGSTLLFAGLYWGRSSRPAPTAGADVTLRVGSAAPRIIVPDEFAADPGGGFGAVADVTTQFRGTGPFVDLTVAGAGSTPWSLVTVWSSPSEPLRDLRVVDGLARARAEEPTSVTVSGLSTPRRGPVDVTTGVVIHGAEAQVTTEVDAGDTTATVPVRPDSGSDTLVAAVTTATEAAAVTDLDVRTSVVPKTAALGETVAVVVTVTNRGPDDQTGPATVMVEPGDALTADAVSLAVSAGACGLAGARAVCAVDPLSAGDAAEVTFAAKVGDDAGDAVIPQARALAPPTDTDPVGANDTGHAALRVVGQAGKTDQPDAQPPRSGDPEATGDGLAPDVPDP
ncbi:MAG TPA: hypothetical protein VHI11_11375 [Jiangellaceae bacterium]|jgi:hypothetical protein|nr:hypothetical protein [Jiangellaceae bacterium]